MSETTTSAPPWKGWDKLTESQQDYVLSMCQRFLEQLNHLDLERIRRNPTAGFTSDGLRQHLLAWEMEYLIDSILKKEGSTNGTDHTRR